MSGKLHELLAVEEDLKTTYKAITAETINTFSKKQDHFTYKHIEFQPNDEKEKNEVEGEVPMVETVNGKLSHFSKSGIKYLDAFYQKELTNTLAVADIILDDGRVLVQNVPATALLGLERELLKIQEVYSSIPTLEPTLVWENDYLENEGISKNITSRTRTKKITKPFILYAATDKHPAQVDKIVEDVVTGNVVTTLRSSKISPAKKSLLLSRVEELKRAVKKARMRANQQDHATSLLGSSLFDFINS